MSSSNQEKEDFTTKKSNGFSFFEIFIACATVLTFTFTVVPAISTLAVHKGVLEDRRTIALHVHEELQHALITGDYKPYSKREIINANLVTVKQISGNQEIKVCARWENVRRKKESFCLYGAIPE